MSDRPTEACSFNLAQFKLPNVKTQNIFENKSKLSRNKLHQAGISNPGPIPRLQVQGAIPNNQSCCCSNPFSLQPTANPIFGRLDTSYMLLHVAI